MQDEHGSIKTSISCETSYNSHFVASKSMFSYYEFSYEPLNLLQGFRQFSSHLPRNLHLVAIWRSPDNAIRKKHATRHV